MPESRVQWSCVAAVLLFAATGWAEKPDAAPPAPAALDTPAAEAELILGDGYWIEVRRGAVTESYGGELVKATDKWVVLRGRPFVNQTCEGIPFLMDLPLIGDWFCSYTDEVLVNDSWIPREAATLRSHMRSAKAKAVKPIEADEPQASGLCHVSTVAGDKAVHFIRFLTAVDDDDVTLSVCGDKDPLRVARRDILSIETSHADQELAAEPASEEGGDEDRE